MSTVVQQPQSRQQNSTRGSRKNRRGGNRSQTTPTAKVDSAAPATDLQVVTTTTAENPTMDGAQAASDADEAAVCWICAEPVKYYSVSECNHRTCHVCALRLRALYKKMECTFCKEPQPTVIFTTSPDAAFSSYTPDSIPFKDSKLSIFFETQDMMEDTLILLRFNCPDQSCDYIASGWGDLKLHVRAVHGKLMCDLCIRSKKVFSHEHALYPPNQLSLHLPSIPHRNQKPVPKDKIEGGVHPLCEFCRECFFSDDELYAHMRERHEECFVCKRQEIRDQYFRDYQALEHHFTTAHFPCRQAECLAQKFVVFGSALDLQAHMVENHGAVMSARDRKAAMHLETDFQFEDNAGGRDRGRGRRGEREPPPQPAPRPPAAGGGGRRREGFGAHLTGSGESSAVATPSHRRSPSPARQRTPSPPRDVDPVVAERHATLLSRLRTLAPNPTNAEIAVKAAVRSFRASESTSRDLISTVWSVLDRNLDNTATIINLLVDLFDDEEKKSDLLGAWNGFKIEQRRQFPELVPTGTGSDFAGITSGRVLNAKHSTANRLGAQPSRVWDRVAQAASSSRAALSSAPAAPRPVRLPEHFPSLQPAGPSTAVPRSNAQQRTPWTGNTPAASTANVPRPYSVPGPGITSANKASAGRAKGLDLSNKAFPGLPTSTTTRQKPPVSGNISLKKIVGNTTPAAPAWGANGASNNPNPTQDAEAGGAEINDRPNEVPSQSKKGKGKQKQKQTLFTLGSFPS